jgi:hypothetical protein
MAELHGIDDIVDVLDFLFASKDAYVDARKDGKVNWADLPKFIAPVTKLPPAINGIENIPAQGKDLSEDEITFLIERYKEHLPGDDERKRELILDAVEKGLLFASSIAAIASYKA